MKRAAACDRRGVTGAFGKSAADENSARYVALPLRAPITRPSLCFVLCFVVDLMFEIDVMISPILIRGILFLSV